MVCGSSYIHDSACVLLWSLEYEPIQRQMLFLFSVQLCFLCLSEFLPYQHMEPERPYLEPPAEGPAALCPCSL